MSPDEPAESSPDEEERRKRAAELHEQIQKLKSGAAPEKTDTPREPNPREFTEESMREETEDEQPSSEDS
jgi:hypothetical protein